MSLVKHLIRDNNGPKPVCIPRESARSKGMSSMFTIYYQENDTPRETRVGMVSAPNEAIAYRVAQSLFANSTILGITEISRTFY